jgi:5'-nucleotidase
MSNRRDFFKNIFLAGAGLAAFKAFPAELSARKKVIKLTILHTNDVHSHIEPFPANDPKHPNIGGAARRAALIKKIRQEEQNVLLFDAGDIFQGTPYFNKFGGELEFKLMSEMGYDAAAIGNHDFDNGIEGLAKMLPNANFPLLCANYDFTGTIMEGKCLPSKIFNKDGLKVGVFGLGIDPEGLIDKRLYSGMKFLDPVQTAAVYSHKLKKEMACDVVICLSHLGFKYASNKISDLSLAKRSKNIDIIIGGHTHTFLDTPQLHKNSDGEDVIVSQAGWAGLRLGKIDCYVELKEKKFLTSSCESGKIIFMSGDAIKIDESILNA